MGAYLRKPVTEKSSTHGEQTVGGWRLRYAATAMQGWRVSMEDAHSIIPELDAETSLFAVYDGHGGKEVALYSALHLPDLITSSESYKSQNLEQALKDAFMLCDRQVLGEEAVAEMKSMLQDSMEEEESSGDEPAMLLQEAERPLETILAEYRMLGRTLMREEMKKGSSVGSNQERMGASIENRNASELFLQLLGGEIKDSDSSEEEEQGEKEEEEEEEEGEEVDEEEEEKEEREEEDEQQEERSEIDSRPDKTEDKTLDHDAKSTHEPTKASCDATVKEVGGSRTQLKLGGQHPSRATDSFNATPGEKPGENSTPSSLTNCNSDEQNASQNSPISCAVGGNSAAKVPPSTSNNLETSNELTSSTTSKSTYPDSDSRSVDTTRGKGLLDLLTSSIQDRFPRTPTLETHEELTSRNVSTERSPSAFMEACLPPISPFVRASRKRPHAEDFDDQLEELESPKRLCRPVVDDEGYHSGTTAVVCLLKGKSLVVANAGDSRCVLAHKGTAVDMSLDHKPTDSPELERIVRAGGQVGADSRVNGGLNLSRAIGDHFYKENQSLPLEEQMITAMPDVRMRTITEGDDFFVVACDGIWNSLSSQEVVDFVQRRLAKGNPEELATICEALCDTCLALDTDNDGTGCDNMTCMIVLLSQPNSQEHT